MHMRLWLEKLNVRDNMEDTDVDGRIISEYILQKWGCEDANWIHLAQNRDQWQALVNTVMNFRFPEIRRIS